MIWHTIILPRHLQKDPCQTPLLASTVMPTPSSKTQGRPTTSEAPQLPSEESRAENRLYDPFTVERDLAKLIAVCMALIGVLLINTTSVAGDRKEPAAASIPPDQVAKRQ